MQRDGGKLRRVKYNEQNAVKIRTFTSNPGAGLVLEMPVWRRLTNLQKIFFSINIIAD